MYLPPQFIDADPEEADRLIAAFPLAVLVAQGAGGLVANPLPLLRDGAGLIGHVARAGRLPELVTGGAEVLALFRGEDAYVSPGWYPSKAETHRAVPTWNYQVVQVAGRIHWDDSDRFKRRAVGLLTRKMEGAAGWKMADAPRDYIDAMLAAIVGFRITMERVIAKTKASQNRSDGDFAAVAGQMEAQGKPGLAARMRRLRR